MFKYLRHALLASPTTRLLPGSVAAFAGLMGLASNASAFYVHAYGHVYCDRGNGMAQPLVHVTVKAMNSNTDFDTFSDDEMGASFTDDSGGFSIDAEGGDMVAPWDKPDTYIRTVFADTFWRYSLGDGERVRVIDEIYRANVNDTERHAHNDSDGELDFGDIVLGPDDQSCANYMDALTVYEDYRTLKGGEHPPAGKLDVQRYALPVNDAPWADLDTIHWYTTANSSRFTIAHEFGHTIRHSADGDGAHFLYDATRFRYARAEGHDACSVTEEGFAFNEGWAEYWQRGGGCGGGRDYAREGDVANALRALEGCAGRADMVDVLLHNPGAIHTYPEFRDALLAEKPECGMVPGSLTVVPEDFDPSSVATEFEGGLLNADELLAPPPVACSFGGPVRHSAGPVATALAVGLALSWRRRARG